MPSPKVLYQCEVFCTNNEWQEATEPAHTLEFAKGQLAQLRSAWPDLPRRIVRYRRDPKPVVVEE